VKSDTTTLIAALRILARDIYCEDGVATAAIAEAADRMEELQLAIRRLAEQDATLSVCDGSVTVTMDATLTDAEREAIKLAADFLEDEFYGCSDKCRAEHEAVATLRGLLERLK